MDSVVQEEQDTLTDSYKPDYGTNVQAIPKPRMQRRMSYTVSKPRTTVVVEPLLGMMFFCIIGAFPLIEQYIYARKAKDYPILANSTSNQSISEVCLAINSTEDAVFNATQQVQAATAEVMMFISVTAAIPSIFMTLIIGGYSDTLYRKPALVIPSLGMFFRITIMTSVVIFEWPIEILFVAAFVDGCFGSNGALMMACFAYLADIIEPEARAFRLVILDVILALAGAGAESLLGVLIRLYGFIIPCLCIMAIAVLAVLYVLFIVPETHTPLPGVVFSLTESLKATYEVYSKKGPRRFKLWLILFVLLMPQIPIVSVQSVSTLYQMNHPLCWGPALIGVYLAVALFIIQAGSFIGSMAFIRCLKLPSIMVVLIGDISGVAAYTFYSMTEKTWQVFIVPVLGMFQLLPMPMSRSIGSNLVDISEQGALFSGMSILYTLASVGGALSFNTIYAVTLPWFRGTVFVICAVMYFSSFVLACFYLVHDRRTSSHHRLKTIAEEAGPPPEDQQ